MSGAGWVAAAACGAVAGFCLGRRSKAGVGAPSPPQSQASSPRQWSEATHKYVSARRYKKRDAAVVDAAKREIICTDALEWFEKLEQIPGHIVTGMPDVQEFQEEGEAVYTEWFINAVCTMMQKLPDGHLACFHNTDSRAGRTDTISKVRLIQAGVSRADVTASLLWHKIALAAPCGTDKKGRPGYTHMLCYIKGPPPPPPSHYPKNKAPYRDFVSFPDCIDRGQLVWSRGMGVIATLKSCEFVKAMAGADAVVVDPFCGYGTVPAVANSIGMSAIGVDRSGKCCKMAAKMNTDDLVYNREALLADRYQEEEEAQD